SPPSSLSTGPRTSATSPLSLHDALPIFDHAEPERGGERAGHAAEATQHDDRERLVAGYAAHGRLDQVVEQRDHDAGRGGERRARSEEHTSELQSRENLVCRLLLEKKNSQ